MYRIDTYFLSKTMAEIPIFLFIPFIFTSIVYFWIGLNPGFINYLNTVIILILVTNVATSFGEGMKGNFNKFEHKKSFVI